MYTKTTNRPTDTSSDAKMKQQQVPFLDKRNQFLSQRKTIQMMNTSPLLQRMVIVGMEEVEVDKVIAADIAFQHKKVEGDIIKLADLEKAKPGEYGIKEGEGVVITAHGTPGMVGIYEGAKIKELLNKITNINKAGFIFISSCDSATQDGPNPSVINSVSEGIPLPVYGSPGIAINDYSQITGDGRTTYKKDDAKIPYETMALLVEDAVTKMSYKDVKEPLMAKDWRQIMEIGIGLHKEELFHKFYEQLILALSGKLSDSSIQVLIKGVLEIIEDRIRIFTYNRMMFQSFCEYDKTPEDTSFLKVYKPENQKIIIDLRTEYGSFQGVVDYYFKETEKIRRIDVKTLLEKRIPFVTQMPETAIIDQKGNPHPYNEFIPRANGLEPMWKYTEGSRELSK